MPFTGDRRLVGLGFGPIQAGLFVHEAARTGRYAPPVVVDVRADLVAGLRADQGHFRIAIARADRVDVVGIGPITALDSTAASERALVIDAVAEADELATALPSVDAYRSGAASSPDHVIAAALQRRTAPRPLIVYCAENHRAAATLLRAAVAERVPASDRDATLARARFVDTVIGKMSGVIDDPAEVRSRGLPTLTSGLASAYLVESFDRFLVSRVDPVDGGLHPGMPVLQEVDDLGPFEDAKLLGHNATHALGGFLGALLGLTRFGDLTAVPGAMRFLRDAFTEESGRALIAAHGGADRLFTPAGYAAFADDLLGRMVDPYLGDTIERAARDPRRKLGWDDRLVGLLRLGLRLDVPTPRYAMGVAAGLDLLRRDGADGSDEALLRASWADEGRKPTPEARVEAEAEAVVQLVHQGRVGLDRWRTDGFAGATADG